MACACGCSQKQFGSPCPSAISVRVARVVRLRIAPVGQLQGVIYRASRVPGEEPKTYVHFFKGRLPMLAANPSGTRLYIVGGQYRVGRNGIHG
jgi:hypothetical protein